MRIVNRKGILPVVTVLAMTFSIFLGDRAMALDPVPEGTLASLILTLSYKAEIVSGEFGDTTITDRVTKLSCPVFASDVMAAGFDGGSAEVLAAQKQLGEVAAKQVGAIQKSDVSVMQGLQKKMETCVAAGGSEQVCGMAMMAEMQSNPEILAAMQAMSASSAEQQAGMDSATSNLATAVGAGFQMWYNESCTGEMAVHDSFQVVDPTLAVQPPPTTVDGVLPIDTGDSLVTLETDLGRGQTRYMVVPATVSGLIDSNGRMVNNITSSGSTVTVGPLPGPAQSGRQEFPVPGGTYTVEWAFQRQ